MKRVLMVMVVAAMAGSVQAAQKPGIGIHEAWWQKTSIEIGVGLYRWCHDRFSDGPRAAIRPPNAKPQNKKAPVNPGELSE